MLVLWRKMRPDPSETGPDRPALSTAWPCAWRGAMGTLMNEPLPIRDRPGAVLRRTGFRHLPGMGAATLCARRNARLRLRAASRHRACMPRRSARRHEVVALAIGRRNSAKATPWRFRPSAAISDTALTRDVAIAMGEDGLPNTFVPGRNLVFLTFAAALAYRRGIRHIIGGMCETDYSGYPDCRDETIKALQAALNLGMNAAVRTAHAADVAGQGRDMAAGARTRRGRAGRPDPRTLPHLLSRRTRRTACLGLWLRRMPGLRAARQGLARIRGAGRQA